MRISPTIKAALDNWGAGQPHPTGDFLRAVLTNDLYDASARADPMNAMTLTQIVRYVQLHLPTECYGSEEKYEAWYRKHRDARTAAIVAQDAR